ncbi:MAG: Tyrosine recombinase XerD [Syntrophorhabdus sp. PtaB.Bin006]|nr:MAG: Tyrosine recombinase XerD [Syntrophorhabdus sp. PtaB.Bin006]
MGATFEASLAWLAGTGLTDLRRVTRDMLITWQEVITLRNYTTATVSVKVRSVKRFFEYLESSNHILINPAEYLKEPKKETRLPRVILTGEEVQKILDQPNLGTFTGIRDRTVLEVFYSTGIRVAELMNLTIYDVDLQGGLLRINKGKGAKDRVVPLGRYAVRFLKEYITRVRTHHTKKNRQVRVLFVNRFGRPLSRQVIDRMLMTSAHKAGIGKHVTPHVFRHTFATALVKNGADITAVSKMLGHSTLSATRIYTRVAGMEVKKTHKRSHPREKEKDDWVADTKGFYHAKPH